MYICNLFLPAILLGHLRLSVEDMKQALYEMDEEILTPELLKQLVAFAPSKFEVCLPTVYKREKFLKFHDFLSKNYY